MVLGYDVPRPKKENYEAFYKDLVSGLKKADIPGLSLIVYGSFIRGDANFGRSDIDAVMIFDNDVIINKDYMSIASKILSDSLDGHHVPFQVSVTDIRTMREGKFNTYDSSFEPYFKEEGIIVVGPDYRDDFVYTFPTMNEQTPVRFNLRKSRGGLLFLEHNLNFHYDKFLEQFQKTCDGVSRASKQIPQFLDGELRKNRFSGIQTIKEIFPEVNIEPLEKIKFYYNNLDKLDNLFYRPKEIKELWTESVTTFEQMIKGYLDTLEKK